MGMFEHREQSESARRQFFTEALRLESFPFVVLIILAAISLTSRIWLMVH
jgi:hypothetical protein